MILISQLLGNDITQAIRLENFFSIQPYISGRKEGNVLFNDALNTFYFTVIWHRTYGKGSLR